MTFPGLQSVYGTEGGMSHPDQTESAEGFPPGVQAVIREEAALQTETVGGGLDHLRRAVAPEGLQTALIFICGSRNNEICLNFFVSNCFFCCICNEIVTICSQKLPFGTKKFKFLAPKVTFF